MSRSLGDGECKRYGVIPDPEIKQFELRPPEILVPESDGDLFVIVASDGVWEFISSQEACEIVAPHENAHRACAALVQQAAQRWKENEGNYRDDITAIVVVLPFLQPQRDAPEPGSASPLAAAQTEGPRTPVIEDGAVFINQGAVGITRLEAGEVSPVLQQVSSPLVAETKDEKVDVAQEVDIGALEKSRGFFTRRLSMPDPFGHVDWQGSNGDV